MAFSLLWTFFISSTPLAFSQFAYSKSPLPQNLCLLENERSAIYLSMPENLPKGSILANLPISGLASGQQANIRLSLIGGRDFVRLNALSKQLVLRKVVDREEGVSRIETIVECIPLPTQTNNLDAFFPLNISIFIAVTDVNDNPPKFPKGDQFHINLPEELPQGTPIPLDFGATDQDQPGPNSHIHYRIVQASQNAIEPAENEADFSSLLAIPDPFQPELFVAGRIDFEKLPKFSVLIEAEDQGLPRLRAVAQLDINVLDMDDLNPIFSSSIYTARELRDGSHLAIEPTQIQAWDADIGFNETIVFSIFGEHSINYAIDALDGTVRLLADRIVPTKLWIVASQLSRPERNATAFLLVEAPTLGEENSGKVDYQQQIGELFIQKIPSNLAIGTELFGSELIRSGDGNFKLELLDPKENHHFISLDSGSKSIRLARKLPVGIYEAEILAKPFSGRRPLSSIRRIHLRLIVFEPAEWAQQLPEFEQPKYAFELDWNSLGLDGGADERFIRIGQIRMKKWGKEEDGGNGEEEEEEDDEKDGEQRFGGGFVFTLMDGMLEENNNFEIGMESGILKMRNPFALQNSSLSELSPVKPMEKLYVMVEDAEGRRNFVECTVRLRGHPLEKMGPKKEAEEGEGHQFAVNDGNLVGLSATHLLGALCFLLFVTNCATMSLLWLGRRQQQFVGNLYDNLSYRYDSMMGGSGGGLKGKFGSNFGKDTNWMLNRALEGDGAVKINKTPPMDFFSISSNSFEKMTAKNNNGDGSIFSINKTMMDGKSFGGGGKI